MKIIKRVSVKDFMGLKQADLSLFPGLNVFLGGNAQGKTSLKKAIIYGLLGSLMLKKKDENLLIRNKAKAAEVKLEFDNGTRILRRRTSSRATREGEEPSFPLPRGILEILWTSPWQVVSWITSKDGKNYLASCFSGQKNNPTALIKALSESGVDTKSDVIAQLINTFESKGRQAAFEEAVTLRRELKRELNALKMTKPPDPTVEVEGKKIDAEKWSVEELKKKQKELESEFKRLMEVKKTVQERATLEKDVESLKQNIEKGKKLIQDLEIEILKIREKTEPVECPLTDKDCPCPEFVCPDMVDAYKALKQKKQKLEEVKNKVDLLQRQLQGKEQRLEQLLLTTAEGQENIDERIDELNKRLQRGAAVIAAVEQYQKQKAQYASLNARISEVQAQVSAVDRAAKILDPASGYQLEAERSGLNRFNSVLAEWKDVLGFRAVITPQLELQIEPQRPLFLLSFSELYRLGAALVFAFSQVAGLNLIFFDDAEVVVREPQKAFFDRLINSGKQIFLFASTNMDRKTLKSNEKMTLFWVKEGLVELL